MKRVLLLIALALLSNKVFTQNVENTAYYEITVKTINSEEFQTVNAGKADTAKHFFYFYDVWQTNFDNSTTLVEHGYCKNHLDIMGKYASKGWLIVTALTFRESGETELDYILEKKK